MLSHRKSRRKLLVILCWTISLLASNLAAGRIDTQHWQVLAVAYPPNKDVAVILGGGEKTLTTRGLAMVKWEKNSANMKIEIENLPAADSLGWAGRQYVLWAIDSDKKVLNLGLVPVSSKNARWQVQLPFRVFGLLVTAESNPTATVPGSSVVLESLLPDDPYIVVPVLRVEVTLSPNS